MGIYVSVTSCWTTYLVLIALEGDFLSILSEIERNYLYAESDLYSPPPNRKYRLDDDRDGTSSADGMMVG